MNYTPDNWVIVKTPVAYRVLAGWSGGYTTGSRWRVNSGITEYTQDGDYHCFIGASGSVYMCHKNSYSIRMNSIPGLNYLEKLYPGQVEILDERDNWYDMEWKL